jgi:HNH endonuclease
MPSSKIFQIVALRANFCCEYCKAFASYSPTTFVIEHTLPLSKEGTNDLLNLALACQGCNGYKYNFTHAIDPATGDFVQLFNPRLEEWKTHFFWNEDFTLIIGQTSTGRATIGRLKLNRQELINIRKVLFLIGEHPPI